MANVAFEQLKVSAKSHNLSQDRLRSCPRRVDPYPETGPGAVGGGGDTGVSRSWDDELPCA
jgi:hypothetical protein